MSTSEARPVIIDIPVVQARRALVGFAVIITLVSLIAAGTAISRGEMSRGLVRLFNVSDEMSYPTWYSSLGLAASAVLLLACAAANPKEAGKRFGAHWLALAAIFGVMSADEIVGVHEVASNLLRRHFSLSGYMRHAWVFPALVFVAFVGAAYLRFLASLPRRTRNWFVIAAMVYVGGAAGVEMVGGKVADLYSTHSIPYVACTHLEEFLELLGIALFNAALLEHLASALGPDGLRLRLLAD